MQLRRNQVEEAVRIGVLMLLFAAAVTVQPGCEGPYDVAPEDEDKVGSSGSKGSGGNDTRNEKSGDESASDKSVEGAGTCSHSACAGSDCGSGLLGSGCLGLSALGAGACGEGGCDKHPEDVGGCGGGASGLFGPGVGPCGPGGVGGPACPQGATVRSAGGTVQRMVTHYDFATNRLRVNWVAVRAGDQLGQNSILRTGFYSHAVVQLPCGGTVHIGSATKVGFAGQPGGGGADLTLKYGSMKVTKSDGPDASKIRVQTPGGTMDLVGHAGGIAYGGSMGLTFNGEGAWERDFWGANPHLPLPRTHFHQHFAAARKADEVRGHTAAGALSAGGNPNAATITSGASGSANIRGNVPYLGKIPYVSRMFRRTPPARSRDECMVLIQPKIVINGQN